MEISRLYLPVENKRQAWVSYYAAVVLKKMEQFCYPRPGLKFQANSTWFSGGYICKLICLSVVVAICIKLCIYGLEFEVGEDLISASVIVQN